MDAGTLQAVVRANGQVQVLDLLVQLGVRLLTLRSEDGRHFALFLFGGAGQAEERAHVLVDDVGRTGDRIDRLDGAVRLNLQNQLIVVGTLAHAGVGHVHRATANRGEQRVDMDDADRILRALVALGGNVTAAHTDAHRHVKLAAVGNRGDDMLGVDQRELGGNLQVRTGHNAGALGRNMSRGLFHVVIESREDQALDVQDDIGDILDNAFGRGELVLHTVDLDGRRLGAVERRQQNATHAVTQRIAVATLQRFHDETRNSIVDFFRCYRRPHELCHVG